MLGWGSRSYVQIFDVCRGKDPIATTIMAIIKMGRLVEYQRIGAAYIVHRAQLLERGLKSTAQAAQLHPYCVEISPSNRLLHFEIKFKVNDV